MKRPKESMVLSALQEMELAIDLIDGAREGLRGAGKWPFGAPLDEEERSVCDDWFRQAGEIVADAWCRSGEELGTPPQIPMSQQSDLSYQERIREWLADLHAAKAQLSKLLAPPRGWTNDDFAFSTLPKWTSGIGLQARLLIRDYPGINYRAPCVEKKISHDDPRRFGIMGLLGLPDVNRMTRYLAWLTRDKSREGLEIAIRYSAFSTTEGYFMSRDAASEFAKYVRNRELRDSTYRAWLKSHQAELPYGYDGELDPTLIENALSDRE